MNFISKGEADEKLTQQALKEKKTIVAYKNRFGRIVHIHEYAAKKFVRRGEGEIVDMPIPAQKKNETVNLEALREQYGEKFESAVPANKKNDAEWIKNKLGEE